MAEVAVEKVDGCDLCEAARITPWFHEDDVCWIAECEICYVPMVVWRSHGIHPPADQLAHMHAELARIAGGDAHRRALARRQHAQHPRPLPRARAPEGRVLRARLPPRRRGSVAAEAQSPLRQSVAVAPGARRAVGRGWSRGRGVAPALVYTAPTMPARLVEVAVELEHRAVARHGDGELRRLARIDLLVDRQRRRT